MIRPFQFSRLPEILFGMGKISLLPGLIKGKGNSIILVTGRQSFAGSSYAPAVLDGFRREGIEYQLISVSGEPSVEMIDQAVDRFRVLPVSVVVAIGGGSTLDTGKALSAMLHRTESVEVFLEGVGNKEHPGSKVPFIAVPTTAGTGSEATKNAVISKTGENGYKRSLRHDHFVPDIALIDPVLLLGCPKEIAIACGMDCFVQLTESYLSTGANPYSDALAFEGLKAVKSSLTAFLSDRSDIIAASGMAFAALTSGICLANAGLGVIHGFASSIGGMYAIPHGVICGSFLAVANEVNVRELKKSGSNPAALEKYARLGKLFLGDEDKPDHFFIDGFLDHLHNLVEYHHLPGLAKYGVKTSDLDKICRLTAVKSNPTPLSPDDLLEIVSRRMI